MSRKEKSLLIALIVIILIAAFRMHGYSQTRDCVVECYLSEVGVREATGRNDGEPEKYLQSTGLGKGYAWCAAFVNWTLKHCGADHNNSAWSPAWFPDYRIVTDPQPGDVFGIYFHSKGRIAHMGFVHVWGKDRVTTVEGNTNTAGSREGDGVYKKIRLTKQIYKVSRWI